jgi:hypothetical protein
MVTSASPVRPYNESFFSLMLFSSNSSGSGYSKGRNGDTLGDLIAKHSASSGHPATIDSRAVSVVLGPSVANIVGVKPSKTAALPY